MSRRQPQAGEYMGACGVRKNETFALGPKKKHDAESAGSRRDV